MAILVENPANAIIEHPEELRTEAPNRDEMLCRDFFDDVWARGNDDRITDYLDDHFHWNAPPGYDDDRAGYARMVRDMHTAFPDLYADVEEVIAADGKVAAHWMMQGHHQGSWMGIKPTGNLVRMEGIALDHVHKGRITREYSLGSDMQMFAQLGVTDISPFTAQGPARRDAPEAARRDAPEAAQPEAPGASFWQRLRGKQ